MKTELEPKEAEITRLKEEKQNLNKEYELQMKVKEDLNKNMNDKDQHIARLKQEIAKHLNVIKDKDNYINKFMQEINTAVTQHEPRL